MDFPRHEEALRYYSAALSIHAANTEGFFILQSKIFMAKGLWEDAIDAMDEVR